MSINLSDILSKFGLGGGGAGGGGGGGLGGLAALLPALLGMLGSGGLGKILGGFQANGLTSQVDSWTSTGENQPVSPDQVCQALGDDQVEKIAQESGMSKDEAAGGIAQVLPGLIDQLSPDGKLPEGNQMSDILGSLQAQAQSMLGGK